MADESMAHAMHGMQVRNEIWEKKKRVYHLRRRNIEISEKTKHVEDLGHDVRTDKKDKRQDQGTLYTS